MERTYEVTVRVTIDDPDADDPEMEFAAVALATEKASEVLTAKSQGFEDYGGSVIVTEVV